MGLRIFVFFAFLSLLGIGCASKETPEPKYNSATYVNDIFSIEQGMPVREVKKREFFFKNCQLEDRHPFTSKIEYSCEEKF